MGSGTITQDVTTPRFTISVLHQDVSPPGFSIGTLTGGGGDNTAIAVNLLTGPFAGHSVDLNLIVRVTADVVFEAAESTTTTTTSSTESTTTTTSTSVAATSSSVPTVSTSTTTTSTSPRSATTAPGGVPCSSVSDCQSALAEDPASTALRARAPRRSRGRYAALIAKLIRHFSERRTALGASEAAFTCLYGGRSHGCSRLQRPPIIEEH